MIDAFSQVSVTRSRRLELHGRSGPRWALWMLALSVVSVTAASQGAGRVATRQRDQLVEGQRLEGQAILALADAAMASQRQPSPADFRIRWRNDFLKAQQGTFVPFTLVIEAPGALPGSALV